MAEASDMTEESGQGNEDLEKEEASKPTSSRSGKKSGSKRVPAKEAAGIVDDDIPFYVVAYSIVFMVRGDRAHDLPSPNLSPPAHARRRNPLSSSIDITSFIQTSRE